MQRRTAQVLLLLAVVGIFAPLALAAIAPAQHACCIRATHHCHNSSTSDQRTFRSTNRCDHECCRAAAVTAQWAVVEPGPAAVPANQAGHQAVEQRTSSHVTAAFLSQSPRAPPQVYPA